MSEAHPVTLDFINAQSQRAISDIRTLRDDVDLLAAAMRRIDNSYDRLESRMEDGFSALLGVMREIRQELRAMHEQHQRTAAPVRALEEKAS